MVFNSAQVQIIGQVFELLEELDQSLFDKASLFLNISLKDKFGEYELIFEDETGWTMRLAYT